jgi:hypothetical protein
MSKLLPRKPVPDLKVKTVDGEEWDVYEKNPGTFYYERGPEVNDRDQ